MTAGEKPAVLVSGGAGYVGSHVALALVEAGYRTVVVDDLSTGRRDTVPPEAVLLEADVGDGAAMRAVVERYGIGAALHLAATAAADPSARAAERDLAASAAFATACAAGGVERFVLTSSAAVYGAGTDAPASAYAAGKLETERRVRAAFAASGRGAIVLRCFNVAGADPAGRTGPRPGAGLVAAACEAALGLRERMTVFGTDYETGDGTCVRDYVHATDVASAHVAALGALERGVGGLTLDCGTGRGRSVREVLAAVGRRAGRAFPVGNGPRRRGDVTMSVARPAAIRDALGWRARHSALDTVVATALAWTARRAGPAPRPPAPARLPR